MPLAQAGKGADNPVAVLSPPGIPYEEEARPGPIAVDRLLGANVRSIADDVHTIGLDPVVTYQGGPCPVARDATDRGGPVQTNLLALEGTELAAGDTWPHRSHHLDIGAVELSRSDLAEGRGAPPNGAAVSHRRDDPAIASSRLSGSPDEVRSAQQSPGRRIKDANPVVATERSRQAPQHAKRRRPWCGVHVTAEEIQLLERVHDPGRHARPGPAVASMPKSDDADRGPVATARRPCGPARSGVSVMWPVRLMGGRSGYVPTDALARRGAVGGPYEHRLPGDPLARPAHTSPVEQDVRSSVVNPI